MNDPKFEAMASRFRTRRPHFVTRLCSFFSCWGLNCDWCVDWRRKRGTRNVWKMWQQYMALLKQRWRFQRIFGWWYLTFVDVVKIFSKHSKSEIFFMLAAISWEEMELNQVLNVIDVEKITYLRVLTQNEGLVNVIETAFEPWQLTVKLE